MSNRKQTNDNEAGARRSREAGDGRSGDLRDSPMMAHLLDALEAGTDVGHYGRLVDRLARDP